MNSESNRTPLGSDQKMGPESFSKKNNIVRTDEKDNSGVKMMESVRETTSILNEDDMP